MAGITLVKDTRGVEDRLPRRTQADLKPMGRSQTLQDRQLEYPPSLSPQKRAVGERTPA